MSFKSNGEIVLSAKPGITTVQLPSSGLLSAQMRTALRTTYTTKILLSVL
jgi:hypothetical protein